MSKIYVISCYCLVMAGLFACKTPENVEEMGEENEMAGLEKAMEQEFRMTRDPELNLIPKERLIAARSYMRTLENGLAFRTTSLAWQERGPNNIAGRTRAILVDKRDATGNTVLQDQ